MKFFGVKVGIKNFHHQGRSRGTKGIYFRVVCLSDLVSTNPILPLSAGPQDVGGEKGGIKGTGGGKLGLLWCLGTTIVLVSTLW